MSLDDWYRTRWERVRAKGRSRYIWLSGVLGWGLPVAVAWSIAMTGFRGGWSLTNYDFTLLGSYLLPALILFPIGGYLWGACIWWYLGKVYGTGSKHTDVNNRS